MPDMEDRLKGIERELRHYSEKMDRLASAVEAIAIQNERITVLQNQMHDIWEKYDDLTSQTGVLARIRDHQASCPRGQVQWLWTIIVPMGLVLIGMVFTLIKAAV